MSVVLLSEIIPFVQRSMRLVWRGLSAVHPPHLTCSLQPPPLLRARVGTVRTNYCLLIIAHEISAHFVCLVKGMDRARPATGSEDGSFGLDSRIVADM